MNPSAEVGGPGPVEAAFEPPAGLVWQRVSPRFRWRRRAAAVLWGIPAAGLGALLITRSAGLLGSVLWLAAVLLSCVLAFIVAELAYRTWGYAERPDALLVVQGVFVRRLTVVPYARMEFVEVTAGPLEQWLGLATVRLHTAAPTTDARIPGLPALEAARLRDRVSALRSSPPHPRPAPWPPPGAPR